jgi:hypothetical protein
MMRLQDKALLAVSILAAGLAGAVVAALLGGGH